MATMKKSMHREHMKKAEHHMAQAHKWISKAIEHPGALHREMGVPEGKKIPTKKLEAAARKPGVEGRRARLAETLRTFKK